MKKREKNLANNDVDGDYKSIVTVSSAGQIILPSRLRQIANIRVGERILCYITKENQIVYQKLEVK